MEGSDHSSSCDDFSGNDLLCLTDDVLCIITGEDIEKSLKQMLTTSKQLYPLQLANPRLVPSLPFDCPTIDTYLQGGVPMDGIVEIFGEAGAGKTQITFDYQT
ncbi:hypothetical protein ACOME3_003164 [Neoechinorhynchus agilis]